MDPGPPDPKRQRVAPWSTHPQGVSLPPPHPSQLPPPHHHPHQPHQPHPAAPAPPPTSLSPHPLHHPSGPGHSHPYPPHQQPPRHPDYSSAPPTPVLPGPPLSQPQHHPELDRRHHEQEPHAPMQDHYRQQQHQQPPPPPPTHQHPQHQQQHSPSQSHPHYPPYPRRDSAVKREPPDDPRRPNSTGHAPDSIPQPHPIQTSLPPAPGPHSAHSAHPIHPPHSAHQIHPPAPPPYPESQPRPMNYDNGHSMPPTPGGYRAPSFPPPTPITHQPAQYEQHTTYQQDPYYSVYSSSASASANAKKKNTRASQACDQCRQLKAKCDETKPCKTCRDKGLDCKYRDPVPKAQDKAQTDILEGIQALQASIATLTGHVVHMDQRLTKIETFPKDQRPDDLKPEPVAEEPKFVRTTSLPANGVTSNESFYSTQETNGAHPVPQELIPHRIIADDEDMPPGPPVPPGEPAIPVNHTTTAGHLLEWPSIQDLTKGHLEREGVRYISEYPISQEQRRGLLIVYGRGEDAYPSRTAAPAPDHGSLEMADDSSDAASPSPAPDWGHVGGLSPADQVEYRGGVLGVDGNPDFSESKVWLYVQSFKDNMLNMHPVIQPKELDGWVRHFLDKLPTVQPRSVKHQPSKPTFAVSSGNQTPVEATGSKRKRSPFGDGTEAAPPVKAGKPDRSIISALVLLVLALGKICLHKENIPDVVHPAEYLQHGSPQVRNGVPPSPNVGSPPAQPHSSGLPSPKEQERSLHSRRSSIQGAGSLRAGYNLKKNYEVVPGLEYFAYATDILGNFHGAYNNMKDVYANIFASLYHGQLGRPMESFAFIYRASHKLQVIMRPYLNRMRTIKAEHKFILDTKSNNLALAFWTCLQLESDLIAELHLPPSGLLSYEDGMPHPNMSLLQGFDQGVLDSYPGQLYLRTHLNSIHRMFYAPEDPSQGEQHKFKDVDLVSDAVSGMQWVAPSFAFKEEDPPAHDILAARLRAKYWGAQVITYRPFIRQILLFSHTMKNNPTSPTLPGRSEFREGIIAPVINPNARAVSDIDPGVVELARKGLKALVESTRAFHGLADKRPIITNIFGTAHAQWGNLLVLSAAWRDPILQPFVDETVLRVLFQKTIFFLRQSATATSSLRIDMHILEGLGRDLFNFPDARGNSSVSSHTTPSMALPPSGASGRDSPAIASPPPIGGMAQNSPRDSTMQNSPRDHTMMQSPRDHMMQNSPRDHMMQNSPRDHLMQNSPRDHMMQNSPRDHMMMQNSPPN